MKELCEKLTENYSVWSVFNGKESVLRVFCCLCHGLTHVGQPVAEQKQQNFNSFILSMTAAWQEEVCGFLSPTDNSYLANILHVHHMFETLACCGPVLLQILSIVLQFSSIAWTHFAKFGSLCQNSTHKQIRHNHSHLCQTETLLSKPNNPLSKCHSDDKMIPTCIIWIHFQISSNTLVYFI